MPRHTSDDCGSDCRDGCSHSSRPRHSQPGHYLPGHICPEGLPAGPPTRRYYGPSRTDGDVNTHLSKLAQNLEEVVANQAKINDLYEKQRDLMNYIYDREDGDWEMIRKNTSGPINNIDNEKLDRVASTGAVLLDMLGYTKVAQTGMVNAMVGLERKELRRLQEYASYHSHQHERMMTGEPSTSGRNREWNDTKKKIRDWHKRAAESDSSESSSH